LDFISPARNERLPNARLARALWASPDFSDGSLSL
jgi:hypothetical protein